MRRFSGAPGRRRDAHVGNGHIVRDGEAGQLDQRWAGVEGRHASPAREPAHLVRLPGRVVPQSVSRRELSAHDLNALLKLLLNEAVAPDHRDAGPGVGLSAHDHPLKLFATRILEHLHKAGDQALLAAPGPDRHVLVPAFVLLREELGQALPQGPLRAAGLPTNKLDEMLIPRANLVLEEADDPDKQAEHRMLPDPAVQAERAQERRVRVHLRHHKVIHVEELAELRHRQVGLHAAIRKLVAVQGLRTHDAVALLHIQRTRLEDARHRAGRQRGAPHQNVRGREVVQQPRRVRPVLGAHGDVDDSPRSIEGLLERVEANVVSQHGAEVLRVHLEDRFVVPKER
mmetsp:Transcript_8808/g.33239  ORF Transcript_8808/g.33239 Transcript_8808/m.33239 type:complete len:343 (+) Transcript_8808:1172-2200(+)